MEANRGAALSVNRGLVYQLEGVEDSTVVEFTSRPENYVVEDGKMVEDLTIIARGSAIVEPAKPGEFATMTEEDEKKVAEQVTKKPTRKTTRKKRTTKKTASKKTSRRSKKQ